MIDAVSDAVDVSCADGRVLRAYDSADASGGLTLVWQHGSPQTGAPLEPVLDAAAVRGIRLISYARPSYGGSTPHIGRRVADAAADVARIADHLDVDRFAVMGASGGGPHVLACAALLPGRVVGAVALASPAPNTEDFDWFADMTAPGGLQAARHGRAARATYAETDEFDPAQFTAADYAALDTTWTSLGADAGAAGAAGADGLIDDDVAFASDWGFDVAQIDVPVLLVQGGADRVIPPGHAEWLAAHVAGSELWRRPADGHISVLDAVPDSMDWLLDR